MIGIDGVIADFGSRKQRQCLIYMIKPPKVEADESLEGYIWYILIFRWL